VTPVDVPLPPASLPWPVTTWRGGTAGRHTDLVADEVPVALVVNGIGHAVMLATPADLEDFALGFALTEGLIDGPAALYGVEVETVDGGIELRLDVSSASAARLKERRRTLAGRTGCGLCGTDSLAQVHRPLPTAPVVQLAPQAIARALQQLAAPGRQPLQQATGASHAAAWCGLDGTVQQVREDVGRHNALDKLVGALQRNGTDAAQGFVLVTSRASFELVQKAAIAGAGALVAVSAPTALAVRTAQACGLALAGFARGGDVVAYTQPQRFGLPAAD
jgi:FdhD protein